MGPSERVKDGVDDPACCENKQFDTRAIQVTCAKDLVQKSISVQVVQLMWSLLQEHHWLSVISDVTGGFHSVLSSTTACFATMCLWLLSYEPKVRSETERSKQRKSQFKCSSAM